MKGRIPRLSNRIRSGLKRAVLMLPSCSPVLLAWRSRNVCNDTNVVACRVQATLPNVSTDTLVYSRARIVLLDGATWNADPRNIAVRVTRVGFKRAEADTAHSEDSLHKRAK